MAEVTNVVGSLSNVVADLGDGRMGLCCVDVRVDEKAGREVQLKRVGEGVRESGWPFCCLLHPGRDPATGQACRGLGRPCQRPLAGMTGLVAQRNEG